MNRLQSKFIFTSKTSQHCQKLMSLRYDNKLCNIDLLLTRIYQTVLEAEMLVTYFSMTEMKLFRCFSHALLIKKFRLFMAFYSGVLLSPEGNPSPDGTLACM